MDRLGEHQDEMWDEEDGFFYDVLRFPDGSATRPKVRSIVGLLPLCATTVFTRDVLVKFPHLRERAARRIRKMPELRFMLPNLMNPGVNNNRLFSILDDVKLHRVLARMLDENEFLSPYGIRALSRYHAEHPYVFRVHGEEFRVDYQPAESNTSLFGGNSNWRGPVWMPMNILIIRALVNAYGYYGDAFTVECPTGSGNQMTLFAIAQEITDRLRRIFLRDEQGRRPVYGGTEKFQSDPHWRDYLLFWEYFHGDNGAGIGASHQTGWTGAVARLIQLFGATDAKSFLERGGTAAIYRGR